MAAVNGHTNGHTNGINGPNLRSRNRFSDIPPVIDIAVSEGGEDEAVEIDLTDLFEDPTELCTLLENEAVTKHTWMTVSLAYAKQRKIDLAIDILTRGSSAVGKGKADEKLSLLTCLCWLYLWKSREAPRVKPEGQLASEAKTKENYIQQATTTLNDASRISPSYPPLFLARGVLSLLRASLQPPSKVAPGAQDNSERMQTLRNALKCFEDALRTSKSRNLMATMGKARVQYSLGRYAEALQNYQAVLERCPDMIDPDPRIGIGACLWQLGHKDEAPLAWERALELNPDSKIANILLGLYHLQRSAQFSTSEAQFAEEYKKAMTDYTQAAFKLDPNLPLACATFGIHFLAKKAMANVEKLAQKAISLTDVNAVASDGWYLLARKDHYGDAKEKALESYIKSDAGRGGDDRGYLPAKFGIAQIKVLQGNYSDAKYRLEKILQTSKNLESMTLLGSLYAEDAFHAQASNSREDKSTEAKKAISLLETVRGSWRDDKKKNTQDVSVLLNLARLYEADQAEKSLQCLQQVEQIEVSNIDEDDLPEDIESEDAINNAKRELLPPQLLNNMGCFYFQGEKYGQARDLFQTALNACVKIGDREKGVDTDALVTTISYNLARTYEAEGLLDEAKSVYEGLLIRHEDYIDAKTRLAYITLQQDPTSEGPKAIADLQKTAPQDLEVSSLYGWFLSRHKKRTPNIAEDQEQRHYKRTLQGLDKHDGYSLTGMGNIHLSIAREMRRDTDHEKDKRRKMYERAVEFYDKAIQLDPRNAHAAQGIGIAMVEDKKDFGAAVQIFSKIKETLRDSSVYLNLGHVFCELKQYSRAIENYDLALAKDRAKDPTILACLGRVWLMRGKQEKSLQAMKTALDYSQSVRIHLNILQFLSPG